VSAPAVAAGPQVVLYSAEWCGACRKAKRYLSRKGIDYEERDVDDPAVAAELLRKTGSRSIPVIDVGGRVLTGFSAGSYDALIERA
jgi:glutaredoxin-like YruB-family protein